MKKTLLATMLLGGMLLCGCDSLIASSSQDSSEHSAPTTIEDSNSYSDKALEVKPLGDAAAPTFDSSTKTYSHDQQGRDDSERPTPRFRKLETHNPMVGCHGTNIRT